MRLVRLTCDDRIHRVDRELKMHGSAFCVWDRHNRLCLFGQSLSRLASAINQLINFSSDTFDVQDCVSHQRMYAAAETGALHKNTWKIERLALQDVPARWDELRRRDFMRAGIVANTQQCWARASVRPSSASPPVCG